MGFFLRFINFAVSISEATMGRGHYIFIFYFLFLGDALEAAKLRWAGAPRGRINEPKKTGAQRTGAHARPKRTSIFIC